MSAAGVSGGLWPKVLLKVVLASTLDQVSHDFTQLSLENLRGWRSCGVSGIYSSAALSFQQRNTGESVALLPVGKKWGKNVSIF